MKLSPYNHDKKSKNENERHHEGSKPKQQIKEIIFFPVNLIIMAAWHDLRFELGNNSRIQEADLKWFHCTYFFTLNEVNEFICISLAKQFYYGQWTVNKITA